MNSRNSPEIHIFIPRKYTQAIKRDFIKKIACLTLSDQEKSNIELSIIIVEDKKIRQLNKQYRGIDKSTDVLSFPTFEIDPMTNKNIVGDVFISIPDVEMNAVAYAHSFKEEFSTVIIHGILHLLGFDHENEEDEIVMWAVQNRISSLAQL